MDAYNAAQLGYGTTTDAAPVTDPRIIGMKEYYRRRRSSTRGRRSAIPLTIPTDELHAGHRARQRRRDDALDHGRRLGAARTPSAVNGNDGVTHDNHIGRRRPRRPLTQGAPTTAQAPLPAAAGSRRSTTCFLLPSLILFTLAITVPAVIGIFFSFTNSIGFGDWEFIGFTTTSRCSAIRRSCRATCSPSGSPPSRWSS